MLIIENINEIFQFHSKEDQDCFEEWKRKLGTSNNEGIKSLISNLESAKTSKSLSNFLSYLVEFNIAKILLEKKIKFEYETKCSKNQDFLFGDYLMSVKVINPTKYQKEEEEKIQKSIKKSGDNAVISHRFASSDVFSFTEIEKHEDLIEMTQIGHKPNTDFPYVIDLKDKIIKHIASIENITTDKTKIIFIFLQTNEFRPFHQKEITDWYFYNQIHKIDFCGSRYIEWFKETKKKKDGNVNIIFVYSPNYILLWKPKELIRTNMQGNKSFEIWSKDVFIKSDLEIIFR